MSERDVLQNHCDSMGKTRGLTNCNLCQESVRSICHRYGVRTYEDQQKQKSEMVAAILSLDSQ